MKRHICVVIGLLLLLAPAVALATDIRVEFSFTGTANGFRLYQNGVQVCETADGVARLMDCNNITMGYDDDFTLTAIDATAAEGSPSIVKKFGRLKGEYRHLRGGGFAGGSM